MGSSIFEQDETLCSRENNACKKRYKCLRFMTNDDTRWIANYWQEFNRLCEYQIPLPKEETIVEGLSEAKEKKG